jgi:transposase
MIIACIITMKRISYKDLIIESETTLRKLERAQKNSRFRDYVRFFLYLKTGETLTQEESGLKIGLKSRQSQNLWRRYKTEGLLCMLEEQRGGSMGYLSYTQISRLNAFLRQSTVGLTQYQIIEWIENSFGVSYTQSGLSDLFTRLKIKLKTGRPVNVRQKEGDVEHFKKNITN